MGYKHGTIGTFMPRRVPVWHKHSHCHIYGFPYILPGVIQHYPGDPALNPLRFYKCLADGTRLRSVLLIAREGELCVCELMEALGESQPKISRHLAQLRECGLVCDRRQGQWVFYRLAPQLPEWAAAVLQQTLAGDEAFLSEPLQRLEDMANRPERCSGNC